MDITPAIPEDRQVVDSYAPGRFQISRKVYLGSVIVTPTSTISFDVADVSALSPEAFDPLIELDAELEVLLLGTGARGAFVKPSFRRAVQARIGRGFDSMDTGAACRTYNILLAEGRKVAAALIAI